MEKIVEFIEIEADDVERLAAAAEDGRPIGLTRNGRPVAAIVAIATVERWSDELELLRRLALGELESAAGEGDDLGQVIEDCRLLLEDN